MIKILDTEKLNRVFKGSHNIYTFKSNYKLYYFKEMPLRELIGELVALEIAKIIGISILNLDIAMFNQSYGILSQSFQNKNEKMVSLTSIMKEYFFNHNENDDLDFLTKKRLNNLEDIWFALEERYHNQNIVYCLMHSIIDIFCFDILTGQGDRHLDNFEILESDTTIRLAPCYDNSSIYSGRKSCLGVDFNDFDISNTEEILSKFLLISNEEQKKRFFNMFCILSKTGINSILTKIELEYHLPIYEPIKQDFINGYLNQMELIFQCLKYDNTKSSYSKSI